MTHATSNIPTTTNSIRERYGDYLTVFDLCDILKVSRGRVDRLLKSGALPGAKVGGQYRVAADDFASWWAKQVRNSRRKYHFS